MKFCYLLETFVFPTLTEPFLDTIRFLGKKHIFALICKNILLKIHLERGIKWKKSNFLQNYYLF